MKNKGKLLNMTSLVICLTVALTMLSCSDQEGPSTKIVPIENSLSTPPDIESPKKNVGIDPSIVIAPDGFARISYYDLTKGDLKFARCTDEDCTTPVIKVLDSQNDVGVGSSLALGATGLASISYYDSTKGDLKFLHCLDVNCDTPPTINILDPGNDAGTNPPVCGDATPPICDVGSSSSLALGTDGFARISYYDSTHGKLKFVLCNSVNCSTPTISTIGPTIGIGGAQSALTLAADGFARISHWNLTSLDLEYIRCTDGSCTTHNDVIIDAGGTIGLGSGSSIDMGADGFVRISYFGDTDLDGDGKGDGGVSFVQCSNADCTTRNTRVIVPALFGIKTSLNIASDGFARVSYFDQINGVLRFSQCTNTDCSSKTDQRVAPQPTDLVPKMIVGEFSSLVMGGDGLARIAYFNRSNGDLMFARCTTSDCSSASVTTIDR